MATAVANNAAEAVGKLIMFADGGTARTVSNLFTFDRGANPPFAVGASSTKVANLDADKLDGQTGSYYNDAGNLTGSVAVARLANGTHTVVSSTATGSQNNWAPGLVGNTVVFWSGASDLTVTGIAGGVSGQRVRLVNTGSNIAWFTHQSGSSSAGNKLRNLVTSCNTPVASGGFIEFQYDGTDWRICGYEQGAWITPTHAAGNYTQGSGSFSVDSGDVTTLKYRFVGKSLQINMVLAGTTTGTTPSSLSLVVSNFLTGLTFAGATRGMMAWGDSSGGTSAASVFVITAGAGSVVMYNNTNPGSASFINCTNSLNLVLQVTADVT